MDIEELKAAIRECGYEVHEMEMEPEGASNVSDPRSEQVHAEIFNYVLSQDRVTCSQIVEATGYDRKVVTKAIILLVRKGFLRQEMVADEPVYFVYVKRR